MENSSKNEAAPLSQLVYNDITRCPKCNLICSLSLSDNPSIINYNCENNHNGLIEIHNYLIECKNYALSKELCKDCGKNQNEIKGEFMYCSTCKKFICPNCIINHSSNEDHFSININRYDSLCIKHSYLFYSYCVNCKKNMCPYCLELHDENHKIINLSQFKFPEKNKTEFIKVIDNLKSEINEIETIKEYIVSQFDKYKNKIELEINFMKILLSSYEYKEKKKILNYNIVQNLWNFNYQFDANQKEYFQVFERIKKNFQILRNIFQNEGKIKKDKKQSFKNNVYEIDKEKLFNLNSNNDNNNILINSCIINKSNDIFQEIKKKENREIEKPENYDKNNYSFSYQGDNIFIFDMSKNKNIKYEIGFMLTNNGNTDWKVNETYLKTNKTSQIIFNDLKLNPLCPGEFQKVILSLPDLGDFDEGDFNIIFDFCVSNKISGKPIKIVVRIIPDPNKKIINDFRKEFGLSKKDYPDDLIYKTLKTCKFDFNKTFDFLLS